MTRLAAPRLVLAALALACAAVLPAQSLITMEMTVDKKGKRVDKRTAVVTLVADGERAAVISEMADGSSSHLIFDVANKRMTTIATDDKGETSAVRLPTVKLPKEAGPSFDGDIQPTGETKELLGYTAERMIVTHDGQTSEAWVADVPGYDAGLFAESLGQGDNPGMAPPQLDGYDNPVALEMHTTAKNGKEVTHMVVTEVASGSDVDLGLFEVPAGVELMDMSALMSGFGG